MNIKYKFQNFDRVVLKLHGMRCVYIIHIIYISIYIITYVLQLRKIEKHLLHLTMSCEKNDGFFLICSCFDGFGPF